jgi:hypothetical protein
MSVMALGGCQIEKSENTIDAEKIDRNAELRSLIIKCGCEIGQNNNCCVTIRCEKTVNYAIGPDCCGSSGSHNYGTLIGQSNFTTICSPTSNVNCSPSLHLWTEEDRCYYSLGSGILGGICQLPTCN